jgi:molybdopterin-biosynthesis enzyme MoeA-like protein
MMEWVLDTHYRHLYHARPKAERALKVFYHGESRLLDLMQRIEARFGGLKVFSLPSAHGTSAEPTIELGVRGDPVQVEEAIAEIRADLTRRGIRWDDQPAGDQASV